MRKPESWWDVFLLSCVPFPVILFYWLFGRENPIHKILKDRFILADYVVFGIGTLVYIVYWFDVIKCYPKSKFYAWSSWYGPVKVFSIGGIWLSFLFLHTIGIFVALWVIASGVKKILMRIFR